MIPCKVKNKSIASVRLSKKKRLAAKSYEGFWPTLRDTEVLEPLPVCKDKWKRDILAVSFAEPARNYDYYGGLVLHPFKNWVFFDYPHRHRGQREGNWAIGNKIHYVNKFNDKEHVSNHIEHQLNELFHWWADRLNMRHSMSLPYKVESYVEEVWVGTDEAQFPSLTYKKVVRYKIKDVKFKRNSRFEKLLSDIGDCPRVISYENSFQNYEHCFEVTDEIIERFQKIHGSLPKDAITYEFLCDKRNIRETNNYNTQQSLKQKRRDDIMRERQAREEKVEQERNTIEGLATERERRTKEEPKSLYLMKDKNNGYYKIGISQDCEYRERTLQSEKPNIELVGQWKSLDKYERAWHDYFKKNNTRGEWFTLNKVQVEFFTRLCMNEMGPPESR
jgi:hypothetical protein